MAVVGKREYWVETQPENAEIIESGGISNNTMKVAYTTPEASIYAAIIGSEVKALFSEEKIELVFDAKLNLGLTSDGSGVLGVVRAQGWNPTGGSPLDWGFVVGMLPGIYVVLRFLAGSPEFVGFGPVSPSEVTRFRIRSDDNGPLVRLQVEVDFGSGFEEVLNNEYADMPLLIGELGENGFLFTSGDILEVGDHALVDNIQMDDQSVIPTPPFTFPYHDGFEGGSWV